MFVSEFCESWGQRGQGRHKCVKREGDGSCGVGDGTRRSSLPESSRVGGELVPDSTSQIYFPWEKKKRTWCFSALVQRWKLSWGAVSCVGWQCHLLKRHRKKVPHENNGILTFAATWKVYC